MRRSSTPPPRRPRLVKPPETPLVNVRPQLNYKLKRRCDEGIRARSEDIGIALDDHQVPKTRDTAISLVALGLTMLEEQGGSRDMILRFCERVLDTPAIEDPRSHTGGT